MVGVGESVGSFVDHFAEWGSVLNQPRGHGTCHGVSYGKVGVFERGNGVESIAQ